MIDAEQRALEQREDSMDTWEPLDRLPWGLADDVGFVLEAVFGFS